MKSRPDFGALLISIDVAAESADTQCFEATAADWAVVLDATKWLAGLLDRYRLPATWFLAGPGSSVLRSQIVNAETRHEIGLLVAENCQTQSGRFEFSRNLERRLLAARAAGVEITSVAARQSRRIEHLDLLVKHGIRAVRQSVSRLASDTIRLTGWSAVSTLRFGISSFPTTLSETTPETWSRWTKGWQYRRQIASAARRRQYSHLSIDAHSLAGALARKRLQTTLRVAARHFGGPDCRVDTLASLAERLMARPTVRSAQSILRAA